MRTKSTLRVGVGVITVVCLALLSTPATAQPDKHTGIIDEGSSITLHPNFLNSQTFDLGEPPDPEDLPPEGCNVAPPEEWVPSEIKFKIDDSQPGDDLVKAKFSFEPGAAEIIGIGWVRVIISGTGSGTIDPVTGDVSLDVNAAVEFQDCDFDNDLICEAEVDITLDGSVSPYPIVPDISTATVTGTGGTLETGVCPGLEFFLDGAGVDATFVIQF